jgi:hydrogenase expression/formation protein HypE
VGRKAFPHPLLPSRIRDGDSVLVSGPLGAHGLAILAARESLPIGESLRSDAAFLLPLARALFPLGEALRFMRDATRGGASAVLNEAVNGSPIGIEVEESLFPVTEEIRTVSDLLGLNPLEIANEGVLVAFVDRGSEEPALERLRSHSLGKEAMCVGRVTTSTPGAVVLTTRIGGKRILDFPRGLLLPRIC